MSNEFSFSELPDTAGGIESQAVHTYKPIWILAAENNAKPKVLRVRKSGDNRNFTGC